MMDAERKAEIRTRIANGWEWIAVACVAAVVLSAFLVAAQIQDTRQRHHDAELAHRVKGRQS